MTSRCAISPYLALYLPPSPTFPDRLCDHVNQALTPLLLIPNGPATLAQPWEDEEEAVQARCVQCLALLLRRRDALESMLNRTHAVTCIVAALDCTALDTQCRVASILLRIALTPSGVVQMLSAWDALRDADGDELRLYAPTTASNPRLAPQPSTLCPPRPYTPQSRAGSNPPQPSTRRASERRAFDRLSLAQRSACRDGARVPLPRAPPRTPPSARHDARGPRVRRHQERMRRRVARPRRADGARPLALRDGSQIHGRGRACAGRTRRRALCAADDRRHECGWRYASRAHGA